jgi:hypothetical protein
VTLNEKRTCYGSTQKNKEPRLGALAEQKKKSSSMLVPGRSREKNTGSSRRPMSELQECIYLSRHESVKIQQYVGIKFGKDIANKIKHSKMETAVTHSEGTVFGLKEKMKS